MEDINIDREIENLIRIVRSKKPNDRSDVDRYWAMTITKLEEAYAIFDTFVLVESEE